MAASIDPTLQAAALTALEAALNRALRLAPRQGAELAPFEDAVFALHCTSPQVDVFVHPGAGSLRITGHHEGHVTTSIRGSAADFQALAASRDPAATLINGNLELDGDSGPLIELQKVLSTLEVDWEAPLVNTLGDVAGHQLAQLLRHAFAWGRDASKSLTRQLEEFIHEEARLSPPPLELEDFYADVRELGQSVERLQLKAQRLRKQIDKLRG
ncbi:MAG: SCP2 sterol-binding domain-containing protein [Gammaproteobacteria bacterium]|nr:SCP2 sterol-binding domain-containing protein [Gammaproteobacteria bacterium]